MMIFKNEDINILDQKQVSMRLRSEFNDLKRTSTAVGKELKIKKSEIETYLSGKFQEKKFLNFLIRFCEYYPVDISSLLIIKKDTQKGIFYFSNEKAKKSKRIFSRKDKFGKMTPYYEYRDTAKSNLSHFYPEWIFQIRYVENSDPYNPDVVYNNGHFLHQLNLFVGPVNYYYEINKKKICIEMNTGDTSYISPFIKHSFAKRKKNEEAYIVAVTAGSALKRNQNEVRKLGDRFFNEAFLKNLQKIDYFRSSIDRALDNELISKQKFKKMLGNEIYKKIYSNKLFEKLNISDINKISKLISLAPNDLVINQNEDKEVVDRLFKIEDYEYFPSPKKRNYKIHRAAKSDNFLNLKGFIFNVISKNFPTKGVSFSLNLYLFNFGSSPLDFKWKFNNKEFIKTLNPGDSIFVEPFIKFKLASQIKDGWVYLVTSESSVDLETVKEFSSIKDNTRLLNDCKQWFTGDNRE